MRKSYSIGTDGIDNYIWDVRRKARSVLGVDRGDSVCYPLVWYISTGRASCEFLRKLIAASPTRIARILMGGGSDAYIISQIQKAIKFKESGL